MRLFCFSYLGSILGADMASHRQLTFKVEKTIDTYRENDKALWQNGHAEQRWGLGGSKTAQEF